MTKLVRFSWIVGIGILVGLSLTLLALNQPSTATTLAKPTPTPKSLAQPSALRIHQLSGIVVDATGPVAGATVRVHLSEQATTTAQNGTFTLRDLNATGAVTVTAWAAGYTIAWTRVQSADAPIKLQLNPYHTTDNVKYTWFEQDGVEGSAACGTCHTAYTEWQEDAHAQTATNYRFQTLYAGTDIHGNKSPLPRYTSNGKIAPPDLNQH